jgi:hypothetical protein
MKPQELGVGGANAVRLLNALQTAAAGLKANADGTIPSSTANNTVSFTTIARPVNGVSYSYQVMGIINPNTQDITVQVWSITRLGRPGPENVSKEFLDSMVKILKIREPPNAD